MPALRPHRLVVVVLALVVAGPVRGQNTALTWSGAGADSNWTTIGNWNLTSNGQPSG
jgi:hypothetical protein